MPRQFSAKFYPIWCKWSCWQDRSIQTQIYGYFKPL